MQTQTQGTTAQRMQRFFREWNSEFTRAVEMFAGEAPMVTCSPFAVPDEQGPLEEYLWWRQDFDGPAQAAVWIGAAEATWTTLGAGLGSGPDGVRDIFLEMLGQSLQGTANALSAGLPAPLVCGEGQIASAPSLASLEIAEIGITLKGAALVPVLVAVEPSLLLATNAPDPVPETLRSLDRHTAAPERDLGLMLDRVIDLELPMSIALGRAVLPIRDVLKLTAGSVIELDHHVGDNVEVLVHGTVVAKGEVVSVKGNYAIRIQEIISQRDRLALQRKDKRVVPATAD